MNADGSSPTSLITAAGFYPAWSPDGTKMAFTSDRGGPAAIHVVGRDGSSDVRLTNQRRSDFDPAWSPDGTEIAFASRRDGNYEIYVMGADGSSPRRLTNHPADDFYPDWQPVTPSPALQRASSICQALEELLQPHREGIRRTLLQLVCALLR